ncbi:MAG: hypothetical protein EOO12_00090 [Chitinophagaceae bacterium]|nr:MAG: hypothetical protein EOO12_00090 [Chitinophagaceae bacterium]
MSAPNSNLPWSEQFRIVAKEWVDLDKAATMLEETKTLVLSQKIKAQGDIPHNRAEAEVKASPEWHDYVTRLVEARSAANLKKVQMEYLRMKFQEWSSENASRRAEMRLTA